MWHWGQRRLAGRQTVNPKHAFPLSSLSEAFDGASNGPVQTVNGDVTVLVSAIIPLGSSAGKNKPYGYLRVWDGTGSSQSDELPPELRESQVAKVALENGDPSLEALRAVQKGFKNSVNGQLDEPPISLCGRVVNVAIYEKEHWGLVHTGSNFPNDAGQNFQRGPVVVGSWIRLKNITYEKINRTKCLNVINTSSLILLPATTFEVNSLLNKHDGRVLKKDLYNPTSAPVAIKDPIDEYITTGENGNLLSCLAQVMGEPAPASMYVRICFERLHPACDPESPNTLRRLCVGIGNKNDPNRTFRFGFLVADFSAELIMVIPDEVVPQLFLPLGNQNDGVNIEEGGARAPEIAEKDYFAKQGGVGTNLECVSATDVFTNASERDKFAEKLKGLMVEGTNHMCHIRSALIDNEKHYFLESFN